MKLVAAVAGTGCITGTGFGVSGTGVLGVAEATVPGEEAGELTGGAGGLAGGCVCVAVGWGGGESGGKLVAPLS
jgi:hypothetical protein